MKRVLPLNWVENAHRETRPVASTLLRELQRIESQCTGQIDRTNSMPLSLQSTVSRSPDIASEEIDGDRIMMDLNDGSFFGLNPVGAAIWDLLEKPTPIHAIIAHIQDIFDIPAQQCQSDILNFIAAMADKKTVSIEE